MAKKNEAPAEEAPAEEAPAEEGKVKIGETKSINEAGKTVKEDIMGDPPESKEGEKVESPPAVEEEQVVHVRGTSVGGQRTMTIEEHEAWCKENKKKAGKG